jgi:hypothetical protein
MSEGPAVTHARAINLAFRWALGFVLVIFFTPVWKRLGGVGGMVQFGMPIFLTLLAAFWVHRSWKGCPLDSSHCVRSAGSLVASLADLVLYQRRPSRLTSD